VFQPRGVNTLDFESGDDRDDGEEVMQWWTGGDPAYPLWDSVADDSANTAQ
jgi:hypothetical protein